MSFFRKFVILALLAVSAGGAQLAVAADDKVYRLRLAETWSTGTPILAETSRNMAEMARKMSNGRLDIRVDSANKHKAPFGILDLVRGGQYDMGHTASYYYKGQVPNSIFFTTMPFGMTTPEQYAWFYHGGGLELMQRVYEPLGVISLPGGNTGNQMGGWFREEIKSLDDLKGLKMRAPGFAGEVMARLGIAVTNIAPGELYTALERGTIDALEWVGPALDLPMGFHKVARFYYTGWHEPAAELQFLINARVWKKLPQDLQEILRVAIRAAAHDMYAQSMHMNGESWATMKSEFPDIEVRRFPEPIISALKSANDDLLKDMAKGDPLAAEIIEAQAQYLRQIRNWTEISDSAYLETVAPDAELPPNGTSSAP